MKIAEFCVRRPVFATVINILLILIGLVCYDRLTVREYPNIDVPVVTVDVGYPGASAQIMETQVTKPIEDLLSGIEGVDFIKSISRSENTQITVQFKLTRDADNAAADVRDRVGRARDILPDEVNEPVVAKVEADAQPIIWLSLSSATHSPMEVSETADLLVQDRLQTIQGVASVLLFAERRPSMRIWLDPDKLAGYQLTTQDIELALRSQNVEIPAGRIESQMREFTVLAETDVNTPAAFGQIIVRRSDSGYLVRLHDVARIEVDAKDERQIARFKGQNSTALGVIKQSTANPIGISDNVIAVIPQLQQLLPAGMKLEIAYDSSVFIKESLNSVFHTLIEAIVLVVITIFFFLRSVRATFIPLVTIPVTLIGTFLIMYMLGFTINTLTLLAFVIAIGLVVDDAIVVLENAFRHIEEGMNAMDATIKAVREIGFAVVAMTITLAAVFAPMAFSTGRTGKLFTEFALTLAGAVVISGFVALTLTPMMCARMLHVNHEKKPPFWSAAIDRALRWLDVSYKRAMQRTLRNGGIVLAVAAVTIVISGVLFMRLQSELSPAEDRGIIFGVGIAPEGATIDYSNQYAKAMEGIVTAVPEHDWNFIAVGFPFVTQTFSVLGLKPWHDRDRSSLDIVQVIAPQFFMIQGFLAFAVNPPSLGQSPTAQPVEFIVQTTDDYAALDKKVNAILAKIAENPAFIMPNTDLKLNKPELRVQVDREKLAELGIGVDAVGRTLETMLGGRDVTRFKRKGEQYDVVVKIADDQRTTPAALSKIFVRSAKGEMVQLSNVVSSYETVAPRELNHFNKLRAATINATLAPGYPLGAALAFMEKITHEVAPDALIDYGGVSREFKESSASLALLFGLALAFIYLVLAAQFESFIDPIVILLSVPLALAGALGAMTLTGGTLNVYSQIGLIALVGLISKHGIMIVEFANQLRDSGRAKHVAILESAALRLRPILMTTGAMVLGAFPLAFASGAGAEARQAIGWVLVGGMSVGTIMTLFVVPVVYMLLSRARHTPVGSAVTEY